MPNESHVDGAPESASPFPPAFRWETSTQEAPTQVMGSVGSDIAFDEPAEQPLTDPPLPVGTPLGRLSDSSAPPWVGPEPPPIADQQSEWLRLGPEEFQSQPPPSRSKRIIGIVVLAVVVLGLAVAAVLHSLAGGSPNRTGNDQKVTPPPATAPSAPPVPPSPPAAAPPVTPDALVIPPPAPPAAPEATGNPEPLVTPAAPPPAAPPPAVLAPNPPQHRSAGTNQGRAATVPAPHNTGSPAPEEAPAPSPADPAPASAPDGFTRVPNKPWHPPSPE